MSSPPGTTFQRQRLLRVRSDDGHARVGFVELFFDLVFVFAVTQLSHLLLHHLTLGGATQTVILLFAVWWAWIYTTWVTNWLDPETTEVRLLLFALMVVGLIMSAAIPQAFESRSLWFAGAYVAMQVGRGLYMMWALEGHQAANYRNFQRITAWFALSGTLWIAGAIAGGTTLYVLWITAAALELFAPVHGFWLPGLGSSKAGDWNIAGGHMAERCGLFIIIALGESILLTGATFADLAWTNTNLSGFAVCLTGSIAMWWIYFNVGAERASRLIAKSSNPGALGRLAYTYVHIIIVAGIIVSAASDELVLKHPADHVKAAYALTITGGPALFLLGCMLFKWTTAGWPPLSHMVGIGLLAALFALAHSLSLMAVASLATGVLVLVAAWETWSLRHEIAEARAHAHGHGAHQHKENAS